MLRSALALWRGPALADFEYEAFARDEIGRLEELRLVALGLRLEADLALGRAAEVVPELEALVREHPLRERLRELLILALYRAGRQADALAAYQDARAAWSTSSASTRARRCSSSRRRSCCRTRRSTSPPRRRGPADRDGHLPVHRHRGLDRAARPARERRVRRLLDEHRACCATRSRTQAAARSTRRATRSSSPSRRAAGAVAAAARAPARDWPRRSCRSGSASTPASRRRPDRATSASTSSAPRGSARPATAVRC